MYRVTWRSLLGKEHLDIVNAHELIGLRIIITLAMGTIISIEEITHLY